MMPMNATRPSTAVPALLALAIAATLGLSACSKGDAPETHE